MPDSIFPHIIPSLREWRGGQGSFGLTASARIVVGGAALAETAEGFQQELAAMNDLNLKIISGQPKAGDIFLTLAKPDAQLGTQGYQLEITDQVTISASTTTGVFYGTQTLRQMLRETT